MNRLAGATVLLAALTFSTTAFAQSSPSTSESEDVRPATPTVSGTTGLWFVPTAEVLPAGKWSASLHRTNIDDGQGFSDISNFPATFAVGIANRAEVFGSWALVTRIDRDTQPLFFSNPAGDKLGTGGGILVDYPLDRAQWIGNRRGDLTVGGKLKVLDRKPVSVAVRAMVKLPVGDDGAGASSGKADFQVDGIVSAYNPVVEVSGFGGVIVRGNPAGYTLTNGVRWGVGAAFPQRFSLGFRITAEVFGEKYFDNTISAPGGLFGSDGSPVPTTAGVTSPVVSLIGVTWQAPNGFFIGAAGTWNLSMTSRDGAGYPDTPKDDKGFQIRIGYHPGARKAGYERRAPMGDGHANYQPAPPLAATPAPVTATPTPVPAQAPANRPPTVRASCNPCTVEVGRIATISADAQDPDGDPLTYRWTTTAGTISNPTSRQSPWTAPMQIGAVPFTVTVNDGRGGTASDSVTIQVIQPAARQYSFDDVYFGFDLFTLRPDALRVLDEAVGAMQEDPNLRLTIEGHTCNIGTSEYNLALGDRRAQAVRTYLVGRGISAARLTTVTYGEDKPKYDNSREETRRLNRRAALVVRLQ